MTAELADDARVADNVRRVAKAFLAAREITGIQLGEAIGLSHNQIYDRLRGDKAFTLGDVARMAAVLRVPVQVFFDGPDALFAPNRVHPVGGLKSTTNKGPARLVAA